MPRINVSETELYSRGEEMIQWGTDGDVRRRTALETFAGTGAAPTEATRPSSEPRSGDGTALIDVDVPTENVDVRGGVGTLERASLTVADVTFDPEAGLLARGRLTARGTGANDATWLCNRPFETQGLALSLRESAPSDLSLSLAPVDLGDHGVVTLTGAPISLPERGSAGGRGSVASLLRAVAAFSTQ